MIDIPEFRRLHRVKRFDFWIAVTAMLAVLSAGVLTGVLIGIGLSLLWLVRVTTAPQMQLLGRKPGTTAFRGVDDHPDVERSPGVAVLRVDGGLFFATADAVHERLREVTEDATAPVRAIVLDLEGVNFVDSQGAAKLSELVEIGEEQEIELRLARVKSAVAAVLDAEGVTARLGADRIHDEVDGAVRAVASVDRP